MNDLLKGRYKYFTQKELENGKIIPDELYKNIIPTAEVLDYLREKIREPIYINSTYRSPEYNTAVGGAKNSLHLEFNAIDFTISRKSVLQRKMDLISIYNILKLIDRNGFDFTGYGRRNNFMGLGLYSNFIHLDTRGLLGREAPARWRG